MINQPNKLATTAALAVLGASLPALAGDAKSIVEPAAPEPSITACNALKNIGTLYKNNENPYIQEFKLFGRYQYQVGSIAGNDVNSDGFNSNLDQHRRFRLGAQMKFASYFKVKANVNLVRDKRPFGGDLDWGTPKLGAAVFDEAKLTFDAGKAFSVNGLDTLHFTYGRQKLKMSQEAHTSSKKIKTVERSALANTIYRSSRPVGFTVDAAKGSWKGAAAIFSDQISNDEWDSVIGEWSAGLAYYVSVTKTFDNKDQVILDFIYHDDSSDAIADWIGYEWATSAAYTGSCDRWGYMANVIVGDHGDISGKPDLSGLFYGIIGMGTYDIIEGTLEAVAQYQWQGSQESEGIRTNSRIFRADNGANMGGDKGHSGRGDSHHSLYGGLNLYLCGDNAKVMVGVEYQNLDTPDGDADATTLWAAYRMYF